MWMWYLKNQDLLIFWPFLEQNLFYSQWMCFPWPHGIVEVHSFSLIIWKGEWKKGSKWNANYKMYTNKWRKKGNERMTRRRLMFRKPSRNNCCMAVGLKLRVRGVCLSFQATRRDISVTPVLIHLPIHSLLASQISSCVSLHIFAFSCPAPASNQKNFNLLHEWCFKKW